MCNTKDEKVIDMKILLFDIETSYNIGWFWQPGYNTTVTPEQIIQEKQIICISYMWLTDKKPTCLKWSMRPGPERDKAMLKKFLKIYEQADSVVGHNSNKFDIPTVRARLLYHGLPSLPPVHQVDTCLEARRLYNLNSNKLDYIDKYIGGSGKIGCGIDTWHKIIQYNDKKALEVMAKYCNQDVKVLKNVYKKLFPHTLRTRICKKSEDKDVVACRCGSTKVQFRGYYTTLSGYRYRRFKCTVCNKWDKMAQRDKGE